MDCYADRYLLSEYAPVLALLLLGIVDWAWTLAHLSRGVEEANPILRWTLENGGVPAFSIAKVGIAALAGGFLLLHVRFQWVRRLLPFALAVYVGVIGIHVLTQVA